jgi:hypothetical protein
MVAVRKLGDSLPLSKENCPVHLIGPPILDDAVLTLNIAKLTKPLAKGRDANGSFRPHAMKNTDPPNSAGLLRVHNKRRSTLSSELAFAPIALVRPTHGRSAPPLTPAVKLSPNDRCSVPGAL